MEELGTLLSLKSQVLPFWRNSHVWFFGKFLLLTHFLKYPLGKYPSIKPRLIHSFCFHEFISFYLTFSKTDLTLLSNASSEVLIFTIIFNYLAFSYSLIFLFPTSGSCFVDSILCLNCRFFWSCLLLSTLWYSFCVPFSFLFSFLLLCYRLFSNIWLFLWRRLEYTIPKYALWQENYFEQKAIENQQIEEKSSILSFLPEGRI